MNNNNSYTFQLDFNKDFKEMQDNNYITTPRLNNHEHTFNS